MHDTTRHAHDLAIDLEDASLTVWDSRGDKVFDETGPLTSARGFPDLQVAEEMLRRALAQAGAVQPKVIIAVPSAGWLPPESRSVIACAERAGADKVFLMGRTAAAALGAGLTANGPDAAIVVHVRETVVEVAVMASACNLRHRRIDLGHPAFQGHAPTQVIVMACNQLRHQWGMLIDAQPEVVEVILTGRGAKAYLESLTEALSMPVRLAEEPGCAVSRGMLGFLERMAA